jgi:hypothetical protein
MSHVYPDEHSYSSMRSLVRAKPYTVAFADSSGRIWCFLWATNSDSFLFTAEYMSSEPFILSDETCPLHITRLLMSRYRTSIELFSNVQILCKIFNTINNFWKSNSGVTNSYFYTRGRAPILILNCVTLSERCTTKGVRIPHHALFFSVFAWEELNLSATSFIFCCLRRIHLSRMPWHSLHSLCTGLRGN